MALNPAIQSCVIDAVLQASATNADCPEYAEKH
jgi:hypothetical protein